VEVKHGKLPLRGSSLSVMTTSLEVLIVNYTKKNKKTAIEIS
jgi:hypothetical protein